MDRFLFVIPLLCGAALAVGCAVQDGGADGGADADADADTDADADADTDADSDAVGALIRGIHHTVLDYSTGEEAGLLWIPLPIDYATQTPIYVELAVAPAELLDGVEYAVDDLGNFGALVALAADGAADGVAVHWDGVVLTRDVTDTERPLFYAATSDAEEWTAATPVADADYPGIAATAEGLVEDGGTPLERMLAVIGWTSANIDYPTDWTGFEGFDATATYEWGQGSCTGFANIASALGRAVGVPTRTVANYYVGVSQQTHSINEFYLGEELGWRRVEPQTSAAVLPEEYALVVRIVRAADEGEEAMIPLEPSDPPGIPMYTLVEELAGWDRMAVDYYDIGYFDDCAGCDNRAELQAELLGDPAAMAELFERARALWQRDLDDYLAGSLDTAIMDARRAALDAATLGDIDAILDAIE